MAHKIKQLAKDTAIYGGTTILTRILNWLLVPLYTRVFADQADYGIVINLYAWTALLLVILTYGMETGFFRFSNKEEGDIKVYSTTLWSIGITSLLFLALVYTLIDPIARAMAYTDYKDVLLMLAVILAMDAFVSIPFARLRYENRPIRFAYLKVVLVGVNISLNLFFYVLCPWLLKHCTGSQTWINSVYNASYGVKYVFLSNVFSSGIVVVLLLPEILKAKLTFSFGLIKRMLSYSWPILIVGIAGIINQSGDKILYPLLIDGVDNARTQLGIYGANYKIAVIMVMFIQGFRYAFEPFIFKNQKEKNALKDYADVMKYFVILGIFIFLGVIYFIDVVKYFIDDSYYSGLHVVPIVLLANLMFGIFFNLSLWYKLTDKTAYGAGLAVFGSVITLSMNIILVPQYGYVASAWANFTCYFVMMTGSYFLLNKYYPIPYDLKKIGLYLVLGAILYYIDYEFVNRLSDIKYVIKALILISFFVYILKKENLTLLVKH